jgi:hypothetical protein
VYQKKFDLQEGEHIKEFNIYTNKFISGCTIETTNGRKPFFGRPDVG